MTRTIGGAALLLVAAGGCQSSLLTSLQEIDLAERGWDMGPPPPGYVRIVGGSVPGWKPEDMLGGPAGASSPLAWEHIGPRPIVGEYWSGDDDASGRVVGAAPHPTDPDIVYIASASGGIWKTVDAGANWLPLTDEMANLNHGAVALDPSAPDTVYAGTGEYTMQSTGDGLFRSTDGGATWERIATTAQVGLQCSAVVVDPSDSDVIHVTGNLGYVRSTDGGATWSTRLGGRASGLAVNPDDPSVLYVGRHSEGVWRSTSGGASFSRLFGGLPTTDVRRVLVAVAPSNPAVVYTAMSSGSNGLRGMYRSDDGGDTWTHLANTPDFPRPQAWYDMYVGVDPADEDTVYCGGVSPVYATAGIIKTTDGGTTWTEISRGAGGGQTHPDHQSIAFGPGGTVWETNDGGVWKSPDGGRTWIDTNATLGVTQQYTVGVRPQDDVHVLGGTQDNGSIERVTDDLAWPQVIGGDGGFLAFDFEHPNIKYTTYVYLAVQRWIGASFANISGPWDGDPRNFIAPLVMDPNDSDTLLGGTNRVWRTTDASAGANWTAISTSAVGGGGTLNAIAVAEGAPNTIYTGSTTGRVYVTTDAVTWTSRWAGLPATQISDLVLDPADPARAYVSYYRTTATRLYRTLDRGVTWTNVTGDLPVGVGVTALAIDWRPEPPGLYAGTGAGVWSSRDGGTTWVKDGVDLPNVNIGDLQIAPNRAVLYAGTFGRGTWRAALPSLCAGDVNGDGLVDFDDLVLVLGAWGNAGGAEDLDGSGTVDFDDLLIVLGAWGACP